MFATYSITPARAEKIPFAGPTTPSQAGVLVKANNDSVVQTIWPARRSPRRPAPRGPRSWRSMRPLSYKSSRRIRKLDALRQGRVDAYVTDYTLLLNALSLEPSDRVGGAPFAQDPLRRRTAQGLDGVAFINALKNWCRRHPPIHLQVGQRTGSTAVPTPTLP